MYKLYWQPKKHITTLYSVACRSKIMYFQAQHIQTASDFFHNAKLNSTSTRRERPMTSRHYRPICTWRRLNRAAAPSHNPRPIRRTRPKHSVYLTRSRLCASVDLLSCTATKRTENVRAHPIDILYIRAGMLTIISSAYAMWSESMWGRGAGKLFGMCTRI